EWRRYNFGRRLLAQPTTADRVADALSRYDADDAAEVSRIVRARDGLDSQIERLEGIYSSMIDEAEAVDSNGDLEALAPFLEDYLISRDFSRPWAELYRTITDDATDVLRLALSHQTQQLRGDTQDLRTEAHQLRTEAHQLRADILQGLDLL